MKRLIRYLFVVVVSMFFTCQLQAASIQKCSERISSDGLSKFYCTIKLDQGRAGDKVVVLNTKAIQIADGRIISRKYNSPYAVVLLSTRSEEVKKYYPVVVEFKLSDETPKTPKNSKTILYSYQNAFRSPDGF